MIYLDRLAVPAPELLHSEQVRTTCETQRAFFTDPANCNLPSQGTRRELLQLKTTPLDDAATAQQQALPEIDQAIAFNRSKLPPDRPDLAMKAEPSRTTAEQNRTKKPTAEPSKRSRTTAELQQNKAEQKQNHRRTKAEQKTIAEPSRTIAEQEKNHSRTKKN